jgi:predicted nucleotidyltransferase
MQLINIKKLCEFQRWIQTFQREEAIYIFGGSKNGKIYLKKNPPKIQVKGRVNPAPS